MPAGRNVDTAPPGGGSFDEAGDATRRTHLANERTYLAWWRSGLTALAVSFGAGKLVPELTGESRWPYAAAGAGFAVLGIVFILYGSVRQRTVEEAVRRGQFARLDDRFVIAFSAFGVALSLLTLFLVLVSG